MVAKKFPMPEKIAAREKQELSTIVVRVKPDIKATLEAVAAKYDISLNSLLNGLLEDYAEFTKKELKE